MNQVQRVVASNPLPLVLASLLLLVSLHLHLQEGSVLPVSWNTLPSHSSAFNIEEKAQIKDDIEDEGWVEEDEDVDLPRPPGPPPPFPQDLEQSPSFFSGLLGTLSEAWKLTSDIHTEDDVINIKPLVNLTINKLGLLDGDGSSEKADSPTNVLKSMFRIWNPEASNWASKKSREFKTYVRGSEGEFGDVGFESQGKEKTEVELSACSCNRTLIVESGRVGTENSSTCSKETYLRGAGQKVIGFSFYDNPKNPNKAKERKYFQGIEANLDLVSKHYPGWLVRVYYDLKPESETMKSLCQLACNQPSLDICHVRSIPSNGDISKVFAMNWRFFPVLDPQVDAYVSRDLDSLINSREAAAVAEWWKTPHHFHFMRDHPAHFIEVLGSGWGVRLGPAKSKVRRMMVEAFQQASKDPMFWANRLAYGPDQGFLKRYLWPWGKWSAVSHDSYSCQHFPRTSPFPTRRSEGENNFVAAVVQSRDILRKECPPACRPPDHQDWIRC